MQMVKYNIIASVRGEAPTHLRQKSLIIDSFANMGGQCVGNEAGSQIRNVTLSPILL
jgi:hypothetical protein